MADTVMTLNERLIWAAVFAREFDLRNPPRGVVLPGRSDKWKEWEAAKVHQAMEAACNAVVHARIERGPFIEGWAGYPMAAMVEEMLSEETDE